MAKGRRKRKPRYTRDIQSGGGPATLDPKLVQEVVLQVIMDRVAKDA